MGLECSHVTVLSIFFFVKFVTDCLFGYSSPPIVSMNGAKYGNKYNLRKNPKHSKAKVPANPEDEVVVILFADSNLQIITGATKHLTSSHPSWQLKKKATAISMYTKEEPAVSDFPTEMLPMQIDTTLKMTKCLMLLQL